MNKLALTLWGVLLVTTSTFSQFLSFTSGIQNFSSETTMPIRSFHNGDAQYCEVTYEFLAATISDQNVNGENYHLLHIDGFAKMGQVGAPALPAHNEIIAMPRGSSGRIVMLESEYYEYPGFVIHPALEPARDTEGASEPIFEKDLSIYNSNSFYPEHIVEIQNTGISRGTPLAKVQVRPVQFNPVTGMIRVYTKIAYRIDYKGGLQSFDYIAQENSLRYTNLLKLNVLNSGSIPNGITTTTTPASGIRSLEKNYIIITHNQFITEANEIADWKRQMGYTVEVVSQTSWSATQIKSAIQTRYDSWTPKPDYFLIIGDHTGSYAVPGEIYLDPNYGDSFATDLYYACMDGAYDWHPDMAHGRISVSTAAEAGVVVDKIINYEKTPPASASYYSNMLSCAQYQDDDNDAYADRRFCHTSEDIRDYLQDDQGYTAERVYYTSSTADVTTLRYNDGYFSDGQLLATELRNTSFNWNGGSSEITSAINAGKFLVFHRDHGYVGGTGWAHPYYTTSTMTALINGDELPVVFSMNCHTGEFQLSNCFAEKFLRMSNKGAVGVVAAAYYSYSGYNDALSEGMIDAIWADPGLYPNFGSGGTGDNYTIGSGNEIYSMGDVVNQGLYAMEQNWNGSITSNKYQYQLFHWFGDPAMKIWTANPNDNLITATHASSIDCEGTTFLISNSTPAATATLVFNNELIGKVILDASGNGSISYAMSNPGAIVKLCISKHNHYVYNTNLTVSGSCNFPPIVQTRATTNIGETAATANGEIINDQDIAITESGVVFGLNPCPEINGSGVTKVQTSPLVLMDTFAVNLSGLSFNTTYYVRAYAINANGTGYGIDDVFITSQGPLALPWTEDWEGVTTVTFTESYTELDGAEDWDYDMPDPNGRLRFEAGTGFYHSGSKAATLDRQLSGGLTTNYIIANLNLAAYSNATDLELSFFYMHHGEESHSNDRVWVRGNETDAWIEIYDLDANKGSSGVWNDVSLLDVDVALAGAVPSQTASSTFQIRFGQQDNYPATSPSSSDGYTFDDISLTGTQDEFGPTANFAADNTTPAIGSTVYFTDLSTDDPTSWAWSFVPSTVSYLSGTNPSSQHPEVCFDTEGVYNVQLTATNASGSDSEMKTNFVSVYNCEYPEIQASNCEISNQTNNSIDLSWSRGSGAQVMVVIREENSVNPCPSDGVAYTTDAVFGSGSEIGTGNYVVYIGGGTDVTVSGLSSGKNYYFAIYEYSSTGCFLLPACTGNGETLETACSYCPSTYSNTSSDWISNVIINTLNNSSGQGGANSYEDFTGLQTDLQVGNIYSISIDIEMSGPWTEHVWVWVDWNQDCDFDDSGEAFDLGDVTNDGTVTANISIPSEALLGETTMRIIEQNNTDPDPCNSHPTIYGETEDYTVNILPGNVSWLGNSTDWNSPSNWGNSEPGPTPSFNVTVPSTPPGGQFPIINETQNAICNQLTIQSGAIVTVNGTLNVRK